MLATPHAPLLAHAGQARGAAAADLLIGGGVGAVGLVALTLLTRAFLAGRLPRVERAVAGLERWSGLPRWACVPVLLGTLILPFGLGGFNADVGTHVDAGRDPGPFSNPAHYPVFAALLGAGLMGFAAVALAPRTPTRTSLRVGRLHLPAGALVLAVSGTLALAGFPLDDAWHRLFGEDVTLWSPTHVLMVVGASLTPLGLWLLHVEATAGRRRRRSWVAAEVLLGAALLIGLSSMHSEFDYGVPQATLLFHPVLITLAAGIGLVVARIRLGRGAALAVAVAFVVARWGCTAVLTAAFGLSVEAAPLYVGSALLVELLAVALTPQRRPLVFGAVAGLLVGTLGLATEHAWTQVAFAIPWNDAMVPALLVLGPVVGGSAGLVGGAIGAALRGPQGDAPAPGRDLAPLAALVALVAVFAVLAPTTSPARDARVTVTPAGDGRVDLVVQVDEAEVEGAYVFDVLTFQGGAPLRVVDLVRTAPGTYAAAQSLQVDGGWKALVRLNEGRALQVIGVRLPADPGIGAPAVEPTSGVLPFVPSKQLMQREALAVGPAVQTAGYAGAGLVGALWLVVCSTAVRRTRLRLHAPRGPAAAAGAPVRPRTPVGS